MSLAAIVILNAQFGCDSPGSTAPAPPAKKDETQPTKSAPLAPTSQPEAKVEPAVDPAAPPEPALSDEPTANPPSKGNADVGKPVYMPASKSGGDFGHVQFPGQANSAPTPQQQAPQ